MLLLRKSPRLPAPRVCSIAILVALGVHLAGVEAADPIELRSPTGAIIFRLDRQNSPSTFQISFRGKPIIEPSPMIIRVDGVQLLDSAELISVKRYTMDETYPWRGVHSRATNHCHGMLLDWRQPKADLHFQIEVRAFEDGVAFRHIIPGQPNQSRTPDEATAFVIPDESTIWHHGLDGHYEAVHTKSPAGEIKPGEWIAPPMTVQLPNSAGYASMTEAALFNYSGMALQAEGDRKFKVVLGHKHPISYPFRLRYSNDVERVSVAAPISGTITSPWRVCVIGADLNALVNSDIVHNLCPPPDPQLFPGGAGWVKPGRAVWKYLDGGQNAFEEMKKFSGWAGQLGFEYHVLEGFWSRWSDEQIRDLVEFSRQQGVGLWFWKHSRDLRTPEAQQAFFKKLHDLGVAGAKIDFFDHEHRDTVGLYSSLLKEAAKYRIMVNFHGANKPTGEARTWPNELNREAIRGMESSRLKNRAQHDATLPFTRYLAGHGDYTPVHFGARRADATWAHEIATAAVFDEPLLTYAAHPTNLLGNPALPMIKSIPPVWDQTIVLPLSRIGETAAFARRSGDVWFLAIVNGANNRKIEVPLSFLDRGTYAALVVRDSPTNSAELKMENRTVSSSDALTIQLENGGGFIARFTRTER